MHMLQVTYYYPLKYNYAIPDLTAVRLSYVVKRTPWVWGFCSDFCTFAGGGLHNTVGDGVLLLTHEGDALMARVGG